MVTFFTVLVCLMLRVTLRTTLSGMVAYVTAVGVGLGVGVGVGGTVSKVEEEGYVEVEGGAVVLIVLTFAYSKIYSDESYKIQSPKSLLPPKILSM